MTERWERLSGLFSAALERPPADRDAFLDEACAGDAELRAEVVSLLTAHEQSDGFLAQPAVDVASALFGEGAEPLAAGERIGSYLIREQIGRGGMGVVYLAEDTRLGRDVALKVLPPEFSRDHLRRDRLRLEARAAATLSHPGIATVYALEEAGPTLFLTFEYVKGRTLREQIQTGPLEAPAAIAVGVEVARALAAAHARGVVHRDLKPDNVMLAESGHIKILDFGIARFEQGTRDLGKRLTEAGAILGTPAYMSPEQVEGKDADSRSDLFAFGVLMYEMVSGTHPFEAQTPLSTVARVLEAEPPVLWERDPRIPHELDRIVRRCLRKAPAERYQRAEELVADLERLQRVTSAADTAGARPERLLRMKSTLTRPRTWWQVHQAGVMLTYLAMAYPAWLARDWTGGALAVAPFVAFVASAVWNGTLRVHLLFTAAFNTGAFAAEHKKAGPWLQRTDCAAGAMLILLALPIAVPHAAVATLLAAVGIGVMTVSLMIEPATTKAAFPRRPSTGGGRRTPDRSRRP